MNSSFRVREWLVEPQINTIANGDKATHVEPKIMQVLVCLAEHAGEVVSKEKLIREVWAGTFVTDDVLIRSISELRKAFADDSRNPSYIQTIPRGGYRLIAPVSIDERSKDQHPTISHYRVIGKIAEGGMGEVFLGQDIKLERRAALKILPVDEAPDRGLLQRFIQEAKLASQLTHPNICVIHEVGETEDGRPFIAMEYIEGLTLDQKIDGRPLDPFQVVEIGLQIADALDEAHSKGIIHRDIKPANIMMTARGAVKVLDFGLAKMADAKEQALAAPAAARTTATKVVTGTVQYMSPEQALAQEVDHRTDIFSLGTVLYEMATGSRPFKGDTTAAILDEIVNQTPIPLMKSNPAVPAELERIISKALEKNRETRYQSAAVLRADLKRLKRRMDRVRVSTLATTAQVVARPTSRTGHLISQIKRHRFRVLAASAVLITAAASFIYFALIPPAAPKVLGINQITKDNRIKGMLVTDGARLFFTENEYAHFSASMAGLGVATQVSTAGGETVVIPTPLKNPMIIDISPDGSELLAIDRINPDVFGDWPLWILPAVGGSPRRVGDILAHDAAWSRDGQMIVYANDHDLLLCRSDGSVADKLLTVDDWPWRPRFSPDGSRLRFTMTSNRGESLWEANADGANLHPLLPGWNTPAGECCGDWSPNGEYYFFQSFRNTSAQIWAIREKGSIFQKGNPEPVQLTSGPLDFSLPTASKDGKRLFVVGNLRRGELTRYDARTGQFVSYLSGPSIDWVSFSRDEQWMAYVIYPDLTLWRSKVDGTERLQLSWAPMLSLEPRWSPDGTKIAFIAWQPGTVKKIYLTSAEGGPPQPLIPGEGPEGDPDWSADGNSIVFGSGAFARGDLEIHLLDLRTGNVSKLPDSEGLFSPRWSPDGRYICAISGDQNRLLLFNTTTQKWSELSRTGASYPSWSRDSSAIYFNTKEGGRRRVRVEVSTGKVDQVVSLKIADLVYGAGGPWLGIAPDNSPLMLRNIGSQEVYALDLQLP